MSSVLLPRDSRLALAAYLRDTRVERPQTIDKEIWRQLLHAELASIGFAVLAELVDCISPRVLDVIRWPERAEEWSYRKSSGAYSRYLAGAGLDPRD